MAANCFGTYGLEAMFTFDHLELQV